MNERGAVLRVRFDPAEGSEQAGTRPAVVVSPTFMNEKLDVIIVAAITSKKVDRIFVQEVLLDYEACGLLRPSKAMLHQLRAIDKRRVLGQYGVVDRRTLAEIDSALMVAVGLTEF
jgi:mRNA interferase MazF